MSLSRSRSHIFREKPQRGTSGEPFMKRTTVDLLMSPRKRWLSSSSVSNFSAAGGGAGDLSVWESGGVELDELTCFAMVSVRAWASAPIMRASKV